MTQRRNLLKALSIASVPVATWTKPVVNSVLLPAHGATSESNGETPDAVCVASDTQEYTSPGTSQFTVPESACTLVFTVYGAGGGGGTGVLISGGPGSGSDDTLHQGQDGFNGDYTTATLTSPTAGDVLEVYVGEGGGAGDDGNGGTGGSGYADGTDGGVGQGSSGGGGGGGGASAVVLGGTALAIADGGHGGEGGYTNPGDGGAGGSVLPPAGEVFSSGAGSEGGDAGTSADPGDPGLVTIQIFTW